MMTALSTAQPAYGLEGPSAGRTVDIATPQGSTYLRGNSVQSIGASSNILRLIQHFPLLLQTRLFTPISCPKELRAGQTCRQTTVVP